MDARDDLPRVIRAGRHIARTSRYIRELRRRDRAGRPGRPRWPRQAVGDGWVKLVGDWIDRDAGDLTPLLARRRRGRGDRASPTSGGARVTAHVLRRAAAARAAGGRHRLHRARHRPDRRRRSPRWPARRAPGARPVCRSTNFPAYAEQARQVPGLRRPHARPARPLRRRRSARPHEAGVAIHAGTDAGGVLRARAGRPRGAGAARAGGPVAVDALASASWAARDWLGPPGSAPATRRPGGLRRRPAGRPARPAHTPRRRPRGPRRALDRRARIRRRRSGMMARCTRRTADPLIRCGRVPGGHRPHPHAARRRHPHAEAGASHHRGSQDQADAHGQDP